MPCCVEWTEFGQSDASNDPAHISKYGIDTAPRVADSGPDRADGLGAPCLHRWLQSFSRRRSWLGQHRPENALRTSPAASRDQFFSAGAEFSSQRIPDSATLSGRQKPLADD